MAKSNAERQRDKHARQKQRGATRRTLTLSNQCTAQLRALAVQHQKTQGEVIEAGVLAFSAMLAGKLTLKPSAAARHLGTSHDQRPGEPDLHTNLATSPEVVETPSADTPARPAWWPDNADELLSSSRRG